MANTLSPKLQGGVSFEQPVPVAPSLIGSLAGVFGDALGDIPKPRAPTADEKLDVALSPFTTRLEDLRNSDLTDQQFLKEARKMGRQKMVDFPQYESEISGILETYGVAKMEPIFDPVAAARKEVTDWVDTTTEGRLALMNAQVVDASGQLDAEKTMENLEVAFKEDIAEKARIEATRREMEEAQADENTWKARSSTQVSKLIPSWTKKTNDIVVSIVNMAAQGDPSVDTVQEQLAFLRAQRTELYNVYQGEAQASGLHASAYSGTGESNLTTALKPIDNLIAQVEGQSKDIKTLLDAYTNAGRLEATQEMVDTFGPIAALSQWQENMFTVVNNIYAEEELKDFLKGMRDFNKVSGVTLFKVGPTPEQLNKPRISEDIRRGSEDGSVDKTAIVKSSGAALANLNMKDTNTASQIAATHLGVLSALEDRMGASATKTLFNTKSVNDLTALIAKNDEFSNQLKDELLAFTSAQTRMNAAFIASRVQASNGVYSVEHDGKMLHVLVDGLRITSDDVNVVDSNIKGIFEAVQSINILNRNVGRILGVEREELSVIPQSNYLTTPEEIQNFLDGVVTGGTGVSTTGGGQSIDTLQSGNGVIAQRLGIDFASYEAQNNLPSGFLERTASIESGGNPNAQNPSSSAGGLFQQIDSNAKAYGVTDRFDPVQSTEGAVRFAAANAKTLRNALGREPTGAELYLAHQQGPGGATKLLTNPTAKAVDLVGESAVKLNGGHVGMSAGEFANIWISKYNGGRSRPTTFTEATGRPSVTPQARPFELAPGADLSLGDVRPQARPTATESASEAGQGTPEGEGTEEDSKAAKEKAQAVVDKLSDETKSFLIRLFGNEEGVLQAIIDGELDNVE